ncbi:hypothetical protein V491_02492 [Pseudogymnoascus sp. VKM F-3775]|nr:hypothetical protein V491_02492 [Pseudogymnoascus sp. VKM F-3775]
MAPLSTSLLLFCLLGSTLAVAREPYNQEEQNRDATCDNGCFFKFFTGQCSDDAACLCNQKEHREGYLCCMAENCAPKVFPEGLQRSSLACETRNLPFTFEVEKVCGFKLTTTYEAPVPTNTGEAASDCDNDCFDSSFPGGSCTDDPACMCTQQKYRERYFCCMATKKNCPSTVFPDSLKRQSKNCAERNLPFTFDVEKVCSITLTTSSSSVPTATPTGTSDSTKATTTGSATEDSTPDSTAEASSTGTSDASSSGTSGASSSGSATPLPNNAPQAAVILNGVAILVAATAMLLL